MEHKKSLKELLEL